MKAFIRLAAITIVLVTTAYAGTIQSATISESIENPDRTDSNRERDGARKPADVLSFIALKSGDVVLDYGSGGGYWSELFSPVVGEGGKVYAQQTAGERFDAKKEAMTAQYKPFGNVELLPVASGSPLPLADNSVDTVMLSYVFHDMQYAEDSGEAFPAKPAALFSEFSRVLKPGGTLIVIEHVAAAGSSRAESAGWHRTPPEMAKADITSAGFEFVDEAPELFINPDDNLMNLWFKTGLSGKTTTFVHKYRSSD